MSEREAEGAERAGFTDDELNQKQFERPYAQAWILGSRLDPAELDNPYERLRYALAPIPSLRFAGRPKPYEDAANRLENAVEEGVHLVRTAVYGDFDKIGETYVPAEQFLDPVEPLVERLRTIARRLRDAEECLEQDGIRFDHETGEVTEIPSSGGRPPRLLTKAVGYCWNLLKDRYERETGDRDYAPQGLCEKIRKELLPYFPNRFLDPSRDGPIQRAIYSYRKQPERYQL